MFAKLLKHEWKATAGTLGIFSVAALGVGILGAVILRFLNAMDTTFFPVDSPFIFVRIALIMMILFLCLALAAYNMGTQFFLLARFYKSRFTDEGYLTFTLPVNSHQIFSSSLLNTAVWIVLCLAVTSVSVCIAILFGTAETGLINTEAFLALLEIARSFALLYSGSFGYISLILLPLQLLLSIFSGLLIMMTCITIGSVLAKKHKILTAFGIYYGVSSAISIVSSFAMFASMLNLVYIPENPNPTVQFSALFQLILQLALGIGGYFLSTWLMENKLNLP